MCSSAIYLHRDSYRKPDHLFFLILLFVLSLILVIIVVEFIPNLILPGLTLFAALAVALRLLLCGVLASMLSRVVRATFAFTGMIIVTKLIPNGLLQRGLLVLCIRGLYCIVDK